MLLARLRRTGAQISLAAGGSIDIEPAELIPEPLLQEAIAHKAEIVAVLKAEVFSGIAYFSSALCLAIDDLYSSVKRIRDRGIEAEKCNLIIESIHRLEESDSLETVSAKVKEIRESVSAQIAEIVKACSANAPTDLPKEGAELLALATEIFDTKQAAPPKAKPKPAIDTSAFAPAAPAQFTLQGETRT